MEPNVSVSYPSSYPKGPMTEMLALDLDPFENLLRPLFSYFSQARRIQ